TNIKHNNRTMSDKEKERNPHIDESRSDENKYLVQKDLKELYQEEFGGALEDYNAKQKRNDRKIDDYYKHIESSKKTSLQQEMIVQVGDTNDFFGSTNSEKANEILLEWFEKFEERNPNLKVYNAVIHNDEASPHLHLNFVPVASEYKRGLEKQVSFDRAITQQDSKLDKTRPFDDWREKEVQLLEKLLVERGIERKLVGTNEYKDVNEYKEKKDLEQEIAFLEGKIDKKKNELVAISEKVPDKNFNLKTKHKETKTEVIQTGLFKKEKVQKETGNYIFTPKQLNELENIVTAAVAVKKDYQRLQTTDLVEENKELREAVYQKTKENQSLEKENVVLKNDLGSANTEISLLRRQLNDLTLEIKATYQSVKEFVEEHTKDVRAFKNVFRDFADRIKEKTSQTREKGRMEPRTSEFEKMHTKEVRRERDNGLSR
ncbi:plasmid recombination protein, partial [Sporosarcina sp. BP05]|uniref:plasmid recombination protein n=1 Tax=Sporosarcina sp. BP05 TaxID=2758726 RepID=UPI0021038AE7